MKKAALGLLTAWMVWVSSTLVDMKKDVAVLRFEVLGIASADKKPRLLEHPGPILSSPSLPGLRIPSLGPFAPRARDKKEKSNADL